MSKKSDRVDRLKMTQVAIFMDFINKYEHIMREYKVPPEEDSDLFERIFNYMEATERYEKAYRDLKKQRFSLKHLFR